MADKTSIIELLIKLKDAMSGPADKAKGEVNKLGHALENFEKRTRHFKSVFIAGAAMEGMAFGIGEALKSLAEPAIEFQRAQQNLKRATHLSTEQLAAFERPSPGEPCPHTGLCLRRDADRWDCRPLRHGDDA
jgi:hypothetical protein